LNKGGQGIYALDVTDPSSFSTSKILWEFTDKTDADMGYTYSQPVIARLNIGGSGKWVAIFGNGYNNTDADGTPSTTGHAVLYIVDIQTGALIKKIDTGIGTAGAGGGTPNGLASVAVVDLNGDVNADYVYAGDLQGNMWKFDLTSSSISNWKVAYSVGGVPKPLFVAQDASNHRQPITSRPEVIRGPNGTGMTVLFGTGKWLEFSDKTVDSTKPQSFYGLYDANTGSATDMILSRASLGAQTILSETSSGSRVKRSTSTNAAGVSGWYMDLIPPPSGPYAGERVVASPVARNGLVFFVTLIPSVTDPCDAGGKSWLMALSAQTGQQPSQAVVDVNGDGKLDATDLAASGVQLDGGGAAAMPGVLAVGNGTANALTPDASCEIGKICTNQNTVKDLKLGRQSWRQIR